MNDPKRGERCGFLYGYGQPCGVFKDDPESLYECLGDEIHDTVGRVEDWKIEELP